MDDCGLDTRRERWWHPALLRWQWVWHRQRYILWLVISLGILTMLVLRDLGRVAWVGNNFLAVGLWAAYLGGSAAIWSPDKTVDFLLARPVSRRQMFNALVLGGLVPWLLLGASPALYVLIVSLGRIFRASPDSTAPAVFYLVYVIWTLDFYLFTVYLAASGKAAPKMAATNIQAIAGLLLLILASATTGFWTSRQAMAFVSAPGPALAAIGLALAVLSYRAGWRLYRNLDF